MKKIPIEKLNIYKLIGCAPNEPKNVVLKRCYGIRDNCQIAVRQYEHEIPKKQLVLINKIISNMSSDFWKRSYDASWEQHPTFIQELDSRNYKVCVVIFFIDLDDI